MTVNTIEAYAAPFPECPALKSVFDNMVNARESTLPARLKQAEAASGVEEYGEENGDQHVRTAHEKGAVSSVFQCESS